MYTDTTPSDPRASLAAELVRKHGAWLRPDAAVQLITAGALAGHKRLPHRSVGMCRALGVEPRKIGKTWLVSASDIAHAMIDGAAAPAAKRIDKRRSEYRHLSAHAAQQGGAA